MNLERVLNLHKLWLAGDVEGERAYLRGSDLREANLRRANLSGADLIGADLIGANLSDANLSGADLSGADLSGADLSGANLRRANLRGANLRRADLRRAYLSGANLSRAYLSGANLSRAYLRGANLDNTILAPLREGKVVKIVGTHYTLFDPRGYVLSWDGDMFVAGCREFDYEAALAHWGGEDYPDRERGALYVKAVQDMHRK